MPLHPLQQQYRACGGHSIPFLALTLFPKLFLGIYVLSQGTSKFYFKFDETLLLDNQGIINQPIPHMESRASRFSYHEARKSNSSYRSPLSRVCGLCVFVGLALVAYFPFLQLLSNYVLVPLDIQLT
jgi:hypothetical protein